MNRIFEMQHYVSFNDRIDHVEFSEMEARREKQETATPGSTIGFNFISDVKQTPTILRQLRKELMAAAREYLNLTIEHSCCEGIIRLGGVEHFTVAVENGRLNAHVTRRDWAEEILNEDDLSTYELFD